MASDPDRRCHARPVRACPVHSGPPASDVLTPEQFLSKTRLKCTIDGGAELVAHDAAQREQIRVLREALEIAVGAYDSAYPGALRTVITTMRAALAATEPEEKP